MKTTIEILLIVIASIILVLGRFALIRLKQPTTVQLWLIKVFTSAVSPMLLGISLFIATISFVLSSIPLLIISVAGALLYLIHIVQITRAPDIVTGFETGLDKNPEKLIVAERRALFLRRRYLFGLPKSDEPLIAKDIIFHTIPETGRDLLCDLWQPGNNTKHSGLVFIYLHGSAWTFLDKDFGTRPFFRHLASQGHVIMDVAYRLFPEADFMEMVHDTKHAIAWMKANANIYGVGPHKIVIGGGSAGAHLALLAAFDSEGRLTPKDLEPADLSVQGVISLYGQADLTATYYHTCQHLISHSSLSKQNKGGAMPSWIRKRMGEDYHRLGFDKDAESGMLAPILGGTPDKKPEAYALFSPISYVHKNCPSTLIIHGRQDILAPVKAIQELYWRLKEKGTPAVMHLLPQTDHGFDLILPKLSPSAHNAIYEVERFLSLMANRELREETKLAATQYAYH